MAVRSHHSERADDSFGDAVKQIDGPAKRVEKPVKRPRDQQRHAFGARQAEALGNQLAEDDLQNSEETEDDDERYTMLDDRSPGAGYVFDEGPDNRGQGDFAEIAQRKAGDGDPDLHAGNDAAEIADQQFNNLGAGVALFDQLANARKPDGDQREFGSRKKRVHANQKDDAENVERAHRWNTLTARDPPCKAILTRRARQREKSRKRLSADESAVPMLSGAPELAL